MGLPSEYEPFAVVVNEAMCCGCPVIVSDRVGAAQDLIAPVCPEFIFPCGDIDALSEILARVLTGGADLKGVRRRAATHIRTWSPPANVAATVEPVQRSTTRVQSPLRKSPPPLSTN